jgi:hypothetical protein
VKKNKEGAVVGVSNDIAPINCGFMCVCFECRSDLFRKKKRPDYSMCGIWQCDFGYPQFLAGIENNPEMSKLTSTEAASIAKVRTYAQIIKAVNKSPTTMTGHVISFKHDSVVDDVADEGSTFPRLEVLASTVFIGSSDKNACKNDESASRKDRRDLIHQAFSYKRRPLSIDANKVNYWAKGPVKFNALYAN